MQNDHHSTANNCISWGLSAEAIQIRRAVLYCCWFLDRAPTNSLKYDVTFSLVSIIY